MRDQLKTKMLFPVGVMVLLTSVITQSRIYPYTHNKWLFVALGALLAVPLYFLTGRAAALCGEGGLYGGLERRLGRLPSGGFALVFMCSALLTGAGLLRIFCQLIQIVTLPETPLFLIAAPLVCAALALIYKGATVLGRWAHFSLPIVIVVLLLGYLLSTKNLEPQNLLPVLYGEWQDLVPYTALSFLNPFSLLTLLLVPYCACADRERSSRSLLLTLLLGGGLFLLSVLMNIMILGDGKALSTYFTTYSAFSFINVSSVFQRMESLIILLLLVCCICFLGICLHIFTNSLFYLTKNKFRTPSFFLSGAAMIVLAILLKDSTMSLFSSRLSNHVYLALTQVALPMAVFCIFKWKSARKSA